MLKKSTIVLVDDDVYFLQTTKGWLEDKGFEVITADTLNDAKDALANCPTAKAAILDMMPPGEESEIETQMGYRSGLTLARWVRSHHPNVMVVGISAARSLDVEDWFTKQGSSFLEKGSPQFIEELSKILSNSGKKDPPKTFIVHGHDETAKYELKNYLQNTLDLPEPIILHEQPSLGRTIIEKFEDFSGQIDLVFVLLTPDDIAGGSSDSNAQKRRARQNVIFELGYFFGKLQRRNGKVILLHKGSLELPSDIDGIVYIDISKGIQAAGELIRREISSFL